ncbi:triose-phosphate isomerase [Ureaplasma sp. ES3154-GEN]|uniref:triose-phosphate isomerase n=1 Tax=Ureaplasma sp. ES3154-GEN TaxID=2984844 RepID=UPI0021E7317A|nr:triose-phosphate isomerase family protein [Ureaplasma sp. ES3154-GEN]MCV3743716.1 triose-phosphate isomerase [Ureaplasma sp. ES3154-GEN]
MKYFIANFKLNTSNELLDEFAKQLTYKKEQQTKTKLILAINDLYILKNQERFNALQIPLYTQNVSNQINGAYTGQTSVFQLIENNIPGTLIGHSEQRVYSSQNEIDQKTKLALKQGLQVVLCVGESLVVYEQKQSLEFVINQIKEVVNYANYKNLIIAYEPVFAIGTNQIASSEHIDYMIKGIKGYFYNCTNFPIPVLYGGSVKVDNLADLMNNKAIDGVLVGSASLDVNNVNNMVDILSNIDETNDA